MATRKGNSAGVGAGVLVFLGSLAFMYVSFSWYLSGAGAGSWLGSYAQFWTPFVAAIAVLGSVATFLMSFVGMANMWSTKLKGALTKSVMYSAFTLLVLSANTVNFYWVLIGFVLAYIGAGWADLM
ncbi:MAG: hypothetical protein M1504_00150 [Candidatus Marsarchaeota archaeon]|nr:hypothetical protein [Candidatus Marsarchaeota archaeon]